MQHVALALDRVGLAVAHDHPTTGGAFAAAGRIPRGNAGYDIFGLVHERDQPLVATRCQAQTSDSQSDRFQKVPA